MNVTAPLHDETVDQRAVTLHLGSERVAMWHWGQGPRVLLVHGWAGDAADLAPIAAALVRAGYEAVLVDMPAHGSSTGRRTSLVEWMWALRAIVQATGPIEAVVAHSFGAAAATLAMGELGVAAGGAVMLAPAGSPWEFVRRFAGTIGLPDARAQGMAGRVSTRVGRTPESLDPRHAASGLAVPALVLHDPADSEVPWSHGERLAAAWPGARLEPRPGTGHRRILRDRATIDTIVGFVRALPRRDG
jgi:pimeloyl-ACP methyl ester carboxylesterase